MARLTPIFKTSRIQTRLFGVVVFLVLTSLGVGALTYYGFSRSQKFMETLTDDFLPTVRIIEEGDALLAKARRYEKEFFLFSSLPKSDPKVVSKRDGYFKELVAQYQQVGSAIGKIEQYVADKREAGENLPVLYRLMGQARSAHTAVTESLEPLAARLLSGAGFLEVASEYGVYKKNVHDLEGDMQALREAMIVKINDKKIEQAQLSSTLSRVLLAAGCFVVGLGPLVGFLFASRLNASLKGLTQGFLSVRSGKLEEIPVPRGNDEFAEIARVFNDTINRLRGYIQTDEQRAEEQQSLINFLEVVSEAADGDLTVKAPVTADAFGSIADAYNMMVDSLAELLQDTSLSAQEVGEQSRKLIEIFRTMEQGAETQVGQVQGAAEAVSKSSETSRAIAGKTNQAQDVSAMVDEVTDRGNRMVQQNIEGMQLIRVTVQVINKRMKSLSERLLEIGTISQLISEVATRTTILAMNASIEASRAGEQGRGFLVISDEIKRLADKSAEATKQIGGIIKSIQSEAGEVTAALEEETRTVETQTQVAQQTGEAFLEIQKAVDESKAMVTEIFNLSQTQDRFNDETAEAMAQVSQITGETVRMIRDSSRITEGLAAMSETLLASLTHFRLKVEDVGGETEMIDGEVDVTASELELIDHESAEEVFVDADTPLLDLDDPRLFGDKEDNRQAVAG